MILLATGCTRNRDAEFNQLADRYFSEVAFRFDPVQGTAAGFHQYDTQLASESRDEIEAEIKLLKDFAIDFENLRRKSLSPQASGGPRADGRARFGGQLLELEIDPAVGEEPGRLFVGA